MDFLFFDRLVFSCFNRHIKTLSKEDVFKTIIPRNVRLSEAPSHGLPAILYDINSTGSQAYISLAKEMIKRVK